MDHFGTNRGPPETSPELPLARQGSIYSLTFDEFQTTLGGGSKDFGSMNMDELLKSIWNAEETHAIAMASTSTAAAATATAAGDQQGIPRQGSLTLPRTLSQKTVDQVWRDIVGFDGNAAGQSSSAAPGIHGGGVVTKDEIAQHRQPTLGEMTLEEFLVRAGVVRDDPVPVPVPVPPQQQIPPFATTVPPLPLPLPSVYDNGFGKLSNNTQMPNFVRFGPSPVRVPVESPLDLNGNSSDLSPVPVPVPYMFKGGIRGRKGGATVEKVAERRQRRMIKNRESAARSRARKQAYMMELEAEVAKLKEKNKELQEKQIEMMKIEKTEIVEIVNQQQRSKRLCLRRTYTGPW